MGIKAALICALWAATVAPAFGQAIYGFGAGNCTDFQAHVRQQGEIAGVMYFSWLQGFVSATNALTHAAGKTSVPKLNEPISNQSQQKLFADLCTADPKAEISMIALKIYDRIRAANGIEPLMSKQ